MTIYIVAKNSIIRGFSKRTQNVDLHVLLFYYSFLNYLNLQQSSEKKETIPDKRITFLTSFKAYCLKNNFIRKQDICKFTK